MGSRGMSKPSEMEKLARDLGFEFKIMEMTPDLCQANGVWEVDARGRVEGAARARVWPTHAAFDADGEVVGAGLDYDDTARSVIARGVLRLRIDAERSRSKLSEVRGAVRLLGSL